MIGHVHARSRYSRRASGRSGSRRSALCAVPAPPPAAATVWDKRDPSVGPEQPTFTERAISAIPLPYPLACFPLAILLNTPRFLLSHPLDTGDLDLPLV